MHFARYCLNLKGCAKSRAFALLIFLVVMVSIIRAASFAIKVSIHYNTKNAPFSISENGAYVFI